ncbi:hypothetical protein [Myxococcus xanthus]|uniref:Uncharacterized protein n=1 Tax=Myxococcus xanthus TaxID=34 RepID=A0A7Y4IN16_MYXXA|nr:hypothetical protein [Myxococcus xanthus]NOJ82159.1 hypothetical protein [Myxococcus xanthus]
MAKSSYACRMRVQPEFASFTAWTRLSTVTSTMHEREEATFAGEAPFTSL